MTLLRPLLIALLVSPVAEAKTKKQAPASFTAADTARVRYVGGAHISPTGTHAAYTLSTPRRLGTESDGGARTSLHVVDSTGLSRPFVTDERGLRSVQWTPAGDALTFLATRAGDDHPSLYRLDLSGGEAQRIVKHDNPILGYSISRDGRVALLARDAADTADKALQDKGFDAEVFEEGFRPSRLWLTTPFTPESAWDDEPPERTAVEVDGHVARVAWSPDSQRLLLTVAPTPTVDDALLRQKLHIVEASTGEVVSVIDHTAKLRTAAWSPDSQHVAAIMAEDLADPSAGRLMVADAATGSLRELLPNLMGQVESLAWRDADTIVYTADIGTASMVGEVDLDGGQRTLVEPGIAIWDGISWSVDADRGTATGHTPQHPREVWGIHPGKPPNRLTHLNPWAEELDRGRQEVFTWTARDGLEMEGVLLYPNQLPRKGSLPLVLMVHGGPESHVSNGWVDYYGNPAYAAVGRGYAVLLPNYRGSTGRGVAFSRADQHDQAGAEFDDLVDAIDPLQARGLVDPERVGITGRSYGGYASAWGATKLTEHFAAAVMGVGISDQVSKFGTTEIPNEAYHSHARAWPWEDWDYFHDRSPVTWVAQARTPILIMHGAKDTRVHPSQSLALFRYLKLVDQAPVRLVLYPREGHGNSNATSRYDYSLRLLRWFDHYLQGEGGEPPPRRLEYGLEIDGDPSEVSQ